MDKSSQINNPSVGILLISTWKYNKFINDTIAGIRKYFFPNSNVKIYLHTDSIENHDADLIIPINHQPWPLITLNRYALFCEHQDKYSVEYLIYLDIDSIIINPILENILCNFFVVEHSQFRGNRGTPETNLKSTAYIDPSESLVYVCGGFVGGAKEYFLNASKIINDNIQQDLNNNIMAVWHDESHLNRYVCSNRDKIKILDYTYMHFYFNPKSGMISNTKIIPYPYNDKGFDKLEGMVHK